MNALATRQLNLTKLESRPRPHTPWEYLFYVDFEGNIEDPAVADALAELRSKTSFLRVLGCYPARTTREARPVETGTMAALPAESAPRAPAPQRAIDVRELEQWPHRLSSRKNQREDTVIELAAGVSLGGPRAVIIANIADYGSRAALLDASPHTGHRSFARQRAQLLFDRSMEVSHGQPPPWRCPPTREPLP